MAQINTGKKTVQTWVGLVVLAIIVGIAWYLIQIYAPQASGPGPQPSPSTVSSSGDDNACTANNKQTSSLWGFEIVKAVASTIGCIKIKKVTFFWDDNGKSTLMDPQLLDGVPILVFSNPNPTTDQEGEGAGCDKVFDQAAVTGNTSKTKGGKLDIPEPYIAQIVDKKEVLTWYCVGAGNFRVRVQVQGRGLRFTNCTPDDVYRVSLSKSHPIATIDELGVVCARP